MESTVNTLENSITINILKMRDNFGLEKDRQKQIYREIQSFIDPAMNKRIPEVIEPSLIESYLKKPEFITYLLSKIPSAFEHIPEQFKNDKKYVLMAVKESYTVLQYIQSNFTNDPEVIKTAIKGLIIKKNTIKILVMHYAMQVKS